MNTVKKLSIVHYLQLILLVSALLYFGKTLFIPLFFGLLVAIVMHPVCKWLEHHGLSKALAITICLLIVGLLFAGLLALVIWQVKAFGKDAPAIFQKMQEALLNIEKMINESAGSSVRLEDSWTEKISSGAAGMVSSVFQATTNTLFILFITPVYTALIMYHRKTFVQFLRMVVPQNALPALDKILQHTIQTYFSYIKGMVLVYIIVGILNSIGLLALGVPHAVLFGMLCAIMTIVPYIGIVLSALLPISVVWLSTGNIWYPLGVVAVFAFVQYLEANVIFPKVVGTQLHVSTFAMLVAIIAGGILWGVAGMVLFIPFVAILKIISDHIDEWKPLNVLLSR